MRKIVLIIILLGYLSLGSNVIAQETVKESQIWEKERLASEIKTQKETYTALIEKYRTDHKNYQIAKDQFLAHQTLVSIEEVTKVTKTAMLSRNDVLSSHLNLTKLKTIEAEGIELSQKNLVLSKIDTNLEVLKFHRQRIDQATTRDELNVLANDFQSLGEQIKQTSYHSYVLLSVASLQTIQDKSRALKDDLANLSGVSTELLQNSEKNRAVNETTRILDQAQEQLIKVWGKISAKENTDSYKGLYQNISRDLDPIYVSLAKAVSYLKEFLII
jgi:hypothetical protein